MEHVIQLARAVLFLVIAFAVFMVVQISSLAPMWLAFGSRFAFAGEGPMASSGWCIGMLAGSTAAAFFSGLGLARFGGVQRQRLCAVFAVLLCVLHAYGAATVTERVAANAAMEVDLDTMSFSQAGEFAVSPAWYHAVALISNAAAAVAGGRLNSVASDRK